MKKVIIAIVIVAATSVTALSLAKSFNSKAEVKTVKVEKGDFMQNGFSAPKNDVSTAD